MTTSEWVHRVTQCTHSMIQFRYMLHSHSSFLLTRANEIPFPKDQGMNDTFAPLYNTPFCEKNGIPHVHHQWAFAFGFKTVLPPMNGCSGSGMSTDPSSCWKVSRIEMIMRGTATAVAFRV